jgi:protein-tyrosine-phosphatase
MYRIGRRFEEQVVRRLKKHGIDAKRVPLSGRLNPLLPRCDIIIKVNDKELKGQLKYSRTDKVVFTEKELQQLESGEINFLCFGFYKKEPKFILLSGKNFEPSGKKIYKNSDNLNISIKESGVEYIVYKRYLVLKIVDFNMFVNMIKNKQIFVFVN